MSERAVVITVGDVRLGAELTGTDIARAVFDALPIEAAFSTWGDEFYFKVPVEMGMDETATTSVKVGDIGYWPPGSALAIFFGPTPMSTGEDPVPASEVNLVGRIIDDATALKRVKEAGRILIERA
jgi:hypothetical protein